MKRLFWFSILLTFVCFVTKADSVIVLDQNTLSTVWQTFPSLTGLNTMNGTPGTTDNAMPYWANRSGDGLNTPGNPNSGLRQYNQLDIGNFLTGTCGTAVTASCPQGSASPFNGAQTPNMNPSQVTWLGSGNTAITDFVFSRDPGTESLSLSLVDTLNTIDIGWYAYDPAQPNAAPSNLHTIISGASESTGAIPLSFDVPIGTDYGLFITVHYGTNPHYVATYYTQSQYDYLDPVLAAILSQRGYNTTDIDANGQVHQHFALFSGGSNNWYIGTEDTPLGGYEGWGDYQDVVLNLNSPAQVPEPSTWALLTIGSGLLAFGYCRQSRT